MPQNQARWSDKRILFVSGKGGVGKSLVAAAIAREQALAGKRVLLVEIGDTSYYKDFWNLPAVGHEPVRLNRPGLGASFDLALWSGESCLHEYVLYYMRMESLYKLFFENRVMRALINVAPGLNEIAILGKITSGIRKVGPPLDYDVVVVDCYATGHAMALFQAPRGLMEAIKFGPMGAHSKEMEKVIRNQALCGYILVSLLEEMPIVEALEFRERLRKELGVDADLIGNKHLPLPVAEAELSKLEKLGDQGLGEFARYLGTIARRQEEFSSLLRQKSEAGSYREVPLLFSSDPDTLVRETGEALRKA